MIKSNFYIILILLFLTSCASIPNNTYSSCAIFSEKIEQPSAVFLGIDEQADTIKRNKNN